MVVMQKARISDKQTAIHKKCQGLIFVNRSKNLFTNDNSNAVDDKKFFFEPLWIELFTYLILPLPE
jgi:hypothetical protein